MEGVKMRETITLTGMVLISSSVKEYDRRIEILTRERGRISAFAQGARKAGSALSACTIPFTFGEFTLYEGRSSFQLQSAVIDKFFGDIAQDYDMTCYASYFAEMARYFTRENIEASGELLLLYITLLALQNKKMPAQLIRIVYEMRMMMLQGQGLELFQCINCKSTDTREVYFQAGGLVCRECAVKDKELAGSHPFVLTPDALYTLQFILSSKVEKVYSFLVKEEIQRELERFMRGYLGRYLPHRFHAAEFLEG